MTRILDGRALARTLRAETAAEVAAWVAAGNRPPALAAVIVGDHPASRVYVRSKARALAAAGCTSRTHELAATVGEAELLALLDQLNRDPEIDGILVQLPLPAGLDEERVLERVAPGKDVDGFHPVNVGRLWRDRPGFVPATPSGILELLRRNDVPLAGRQAVIVGRSSVVGKPLAALLLREHATVTVCHSRTADLPAVCRQADLLVAAVGRPGLIGAEHVRPGAVVVDVGINRIADRGELVRLFPGDAERLATLERKGSVLVGDVDFARVAPLAGAITPVPGGVGPLTVAMLLVNTVAAARADHLYGDRRRPFLVGLTGGIAAGKSTVAALLREAGIEVVDADRLVAELYRPGEAGAAAVAELFGDDYLAADGGVDHQRLAGMVFADPTARRRLERRIHPLVRQRFRRLAESAGEAAVLEATLLVEAGYSPDFDLVVTVEAEREHRLERAVARGLAEQEARARLAAQGDGEARRAAADVVVPNDGSREELAARVAELAADIRRRAGGGGGA